MARLLIGTRAMPVTLLPPDPATLRPVPGVQLGIACAGIKKPDRKDVLVMSFVHDAEVVGVFTQPDRAAVARPISCRSTRIPRG